MPINLAREKARASGKASKKMRSMDIEHAEGGGFIATHRMDHGMSGSYEEPKKYALKDGHALIKHVKEHCCAGSTDTDTDKDGK